MQVVELNFIFKTFLTPLLICKLYGKHGGGDRLMVHGRSINIISHPTGNGESHNVRFA